MMARPGPEVWVTSQLLALLVALSSGLTQTDRPPPPSAVRCFKPFDAHDEVSIRCSWKPGPDRDSQTPTSYRLHWDAGPDYSSSSQEMWVEATNVSGVIPHDRVPRHRPLSVWVQAESQRGSARSHKIHVSPDEIMMSPTPTIHEHSETPGETRWSTHCEQLGLSERHCEVRYWAEGAEHRPEYEDMLHSSFLLLDPEPFSVYALQVRCVCEHMLTSAWSSVHSLRSEEAAPVGELDVWSDCEVLSDLSQCAVMWKEPPPSSARGEVLGYVLTVEYANGTAAAVNRSAGLGRGSDAWPCDERRRCGHAASLRGVSGVRVSAFNAKGATEPASLAVLLTHVTQVPEHKLSCQMDGGTLSVSWDLSPRRADIAQELVVQYKQAGLPPSKGFDWTKVNNSQTSINLTGYFENYTPYIVSLFAVSRNTRSLLSSAVTYALQGTPPLVPWVHVQDMTDSEVTVTWGHIPLSQRRGIISRYQLGTDNQTVYSVSGEENCHVLTGLTPGRSYQLWLRAETQAGLGPARTIWFSIEGENYGYTVTVVIVMLLVSGGLVVLLMLKREACPLVPVWCYERVPDPSNSQLFKQMKSQFNGSITLFCAPSEPNPKISRLEVILIQPQDSTDFPWKTDTGRPVEGIGLTGKERLQTESDGEGREREDAVREGEWLLSKGRSAVGGEDYSNMLDSDDEERDGDDAAESSSLSEKERPFYSDYEKHFMPTAVD